jgi:hypothetical protein
MVASYLQLTKPHGLEQPRWNCRRTQASPGLAREMSRMPAVKNVGEPCAREPHARFDVAAGGNQTSRASACRAVQAPLADPTAPGWSTLLLRRQSERLGARRDIRVAVRPNRHSARDWRRLPHRTRLPLLAQSTSANTPARAAIARAGEVAVSRRLPTAICSTPGGGDPFVLQTRRG